MVILIFDFGCKDTKFFDKLVIKSRFFSINGFFYAKFKFDYSFKYTK